MRPTLPGRTLSPAGEFPGDGTFVVGEDVIAANGGSGRDIVTIKEGDKAFSTSGCEDWERVG